MTTGLVNDNKLSEETEHCRGIFWNPLESNLHADVDGLSNKVQDVQLIDPYFSAPGSIETSRSSGTSRFLNTHGIFVKSAGIKNGTLHDSPNRATLWKITMEYTQAPPSELLLTLTS